MPNNFMCQFQGGENVQLFIPMTGKNSYTTPANSAYVSQQWNWSAKTGQKTSSHNEHNPNHQSQKKISQPKTQNRAKIMSLTYKFNDASNGDLDAVRQE